jgi:type IX secretion system PorP/SprF family membrane protein
MKMMKIARKLGVWALLGLLLPLGLMAQQRMRYSHYLLNGHLTNPAITGIENYWDIRSGVAQQWVGVPGAPMSIYLSAHKGLYSEDTCKIGSVITSLPAHGRLRTAATRGQAELDKSSWVALGEPRFHMGIGGQLFSERTGPIILNGFAASLAANTAIVGNLRLSVGINMELLNYNLRTDWIILHDNGDFALPGNRLSLLLPGMNAGFALYSKRFFIAGAGRQVMRNRIVLNPSNPVISGLETHFWMQAGLKLQVSEQVGLIPSMALRTISPSPPSLDLNLQASLKDKFYIGASYRHQDALVAMLGLNILPDMRLDYAYDYTTSGLGSYTSGSHSLVLSYFPGLKKTAGRRYFW